MGVLVPLCIGIEFVCRSMTSLLAAEGMVYVLPDRGLSVFSGGRRCPAAADWTMKGEEITQIYAGCTFLRPLFFEAQVCRRMIRRT